jgi:hypothetical protein
MLIVFATNKIITTDTILPILIEANQRNNQRVIVVVSRKNGLSVIEQNIVINDAINNIGFKFLLGGRYRVKWYKRIVGSVQFSLLFIAGIFGAKFIHFETLPLVTLRILSFFFPSRVFYSERDTIKHDFYKLPHRHINKFNNKYTEGNYPIPLGGNIISYNKDRLYYYYGQGIHNKRHVHFLDPTRSRTSWINYVDDVSDDYFSKFHKNVDISNGIIFIILSFYDLNKEEEERIMALNGRGLFYQKKLRKNFENTVKILSSIKGDIPVFLKAAAYTDIEYVNSVLSGYHGFHITYLHPSILLRNARFVVCNWYSTILGDAHSLNVPTVEYSYYPKMVREDLGNELIVSKSIGSDYVDWFVYDDIDKFEKIVSNLIKKDFRCKKPITNEQKDDALLTDLC